MNWYYVQTPPCSDLCCQNTFVVPSFVLHLDSPNCVYYIRDTFKAYLRSGNLFKLWNTKFSRETAKPTLWIMDLDWLKIIGRLLMLRLREQLALDKTLWRILPWNETKFISHFAKDEKFFAFVVAILPSCTWSDAGNIVMATDDLTDRFETGKPVGGSEGQVFVTASGSRTERNRLSFSAL